MCISSSYETAFSDARTTPISIQLKEYIECYKDLSVYDCSRQHFHRCVNFECPLFSLDIEKDKSILRDDVNVDIYDSDV